MLDAWQINAVEKKGNNNLQKNVMFSVRQPVRTKSVTYPVNMTSRFKKRDQVLYKLCIFTFILCKCVTHEALH